MRDIEAADWFVWATIQHLQAISRQLEIINFELYHFEDSFRLHLSQMQQHVRRTRNRWAEGPVRAALVERACTMSRISRTLERALARIDEQAQTMMRLSEETQAEAPSLPTHQ